MQSPFGYKQTPHPEIPPAIAESLLNWVEKGRPTGGFVTAVLCNDLTKAIGRADLESRAALPSIVFWLYNHAPCGCWGSYEIVEKWRNKFKEEAAA